MIIESSSGRIPARYTKYTCRHLWKMTLLPSSQSYEGAKVGLFAKITFDLEHDLDSFGKWLYFLFSITGDQNTVAFVYITIDLA